MSVRQVEEIVSKQKETKTQPVDKDEKNAKKVVNRDISDIERKLKEKLGLRIKISQNKQGGGKVVLQYASTAELDMIINVLDQKKQVDLGIKNNVFKDDEVQQQTKNDKFSIKFIE